MKKARPYDSLLRDISEKEKLKRQKTYQWLPEAGGDEKGWQPRGTKESIFQIMELLYLDCGGGYTAICVCQNLQTCTLKSEFYYM